MEHSGIITPLCSCPAPKRGQNLPQGCQPAGRAPLTQCGHALVFSEFLETVHAKLLEAILTAVLWRPNLPLRVFWYPREGGASREETGKPCFTQPLALQASDVQVLALMAVLTSSPTVCMGLPREAGPHRCQLLPLWLWPALASLCSLLLNRGIV